MKYIVTGPVCQFGIGQKLKLTAAQIDARKHALDILDDKGRVAVKSLIQFKRGEEIDLAIKEDDLPSSLAAVLEASSKAPKVTKSSEQKSAKSDAPAAPENTDDLDALETALESAEAMYRTALEKLELPQGVELTEEQSELVKIERVALEKAQAAYDAAIGEE